jgi:hypothetical protein
MNIRTNILFGILILTGTSVFGQLGKAIITYQPIYEEVNNYFPHDHFVTLDMDNLLDTAASITTKDNKLFITNTFNDGYTGHEVQFIISPSLEILKAEYNEWGDVIDGSESKFSVDKAILSFSDNPFEEKLITAHYTLQIREDYFAGKLLSKEGVKDTTSFRIFNGKFKFYSQNEKLKGREWILDQNEIKIGIKDSLGIYEMPDNFAEFKFGDDSLRVILKEFEIDRAKTEVPKKSFITLQLIIDANGKVDLNTIKIWEPMKSLESIELVKQNSDLMTNWFPATYKGRPVKSEVNLSIRIK